MQSLNAEFQIIEVNNCPLYQTGEVFGLTGQSFSPPGKKDACLILVREMTELLFTLLAENETGGGGGSSERIYSCSGCNGLIKFKVTSLANSEAKEENKVLLSPEKERLFENIMGCSLFHAIPAEQLREKMHFFTEQNLGPGEVLIEKGERNQDIFLVLNGGLSVDDGPVPIAKLGPGELCGEMSYFAGNVAGATVTGSTETSVIAVSGEFFSRIIEESPSVQFYLAQLLAKRLVSANQARLHDFDSSMQGRLAEMVPSELFQILNMHQKTGVLSLSFPGKAARVAFREGRIVRATCNGLSNREAVYAVLAESDGSYTFRSGLSPMQMQAPEIGDFNALLMEGMQRMDEGRTPS